MVKLFCDICGKDCGLSALDLYVSVIHNPIPTSIHDTEKAKLTDDDTHVRYLLCDECYEKTHLPNPYMSSIDITDAIVKYQQDGELER